VELEPFIDVVEAADALVETCTAGVLDLNTPSGRMVARMHGAAARHEVEHAIERMRSKQAELREAQACHVSHGRVEQLYPEGRDSAMLPFPVSRQPLDSIQE
jgi:hypothetical protein